VKLVVFGLAVSSSWGNGHATLWRGLGRALSRRGHRLVFFERDVPYYAAHRDLTQVPGIDLRLYGDWGAARAIAAAELSDADVGMVTSFCPDALPAADLVLGSRAGLRCFYDLDTPVTLAALDGGGGVAYIGPHGLRDYDLVLSYTGGRALEALRARLGAGRTAALYGSVDPDVHRPAAADPARAARGYALSYLGTYAADRQAALQALLLTPAQRRAQRRFLLGGAQYPVDFPWLPNVDFMRHVPPGDHAAFYAAAPLTLNVTRAPMAAMGYCPSARLFEAAACGVPVLSDAWEGLEQFLTPGEEILIASDTDMALAQIDSPRAALAAIGRRARERTLADHTADSRAEELEAILEQAWGGRAAAAPPLATEAAS
jgi:spore maturation protein CgeB